MIKHRLLSRLKRRLASSRRHSSTKGFTLLELLVTTAIGTGIMAGLMFIVVELTQTDQRESSRTETQREMQMALDYISTELREAVYVYTGAQLTNLATYLPANLSQQGVPVLAFWKHQRFPQAVVNFCQANRTNSRALANAGINCEAGSSYALVVYSLSRTNNGNVWSPNNARVTRYALTEFAGNALNRTTGYVNPGANNNFATWPIGPGNVNLQAARPTGSAVTLVDFVDDATNAALGNPAATCPPQPAGAAIQYNLSPADALLTTSGLSGVRSFYACVSARPLRGGAAGAAEDTGVNQDVVLFLRGSVQDRPGYTNGFFARGAETLPTLETRVLARGVLGRNASQ